jgi:hypothetical protein
MSNFTRRDLVGIAAGLAAMAWARPASADVPAPFALEEVVDSGHRFFGGLSRGFAEGGSRGGPPMGSAQRLHPGSGSVRRVRGRTSLRRRRDDLHAQRRRSEGLLARSFRRFRRRSRRRQDDDAGLQLTRGGRDFSTFWRDRRLCLFCRGVRLHGLGRRRCCRRSDPHRGRRAAWHQHQLFEIHAPRDLEPILKVRRSPVCERARRGRRAAQQGCARPDSTML